MTSARLGELVLALVILGVSIWLYRRRDASAGGGYGNQGAVLLLVVGAIMAIHALGGLDYHPSNAELDAMKGQ